MCLCYCFTKSLPVFHNRKELLLAILPQKNVLMCFKHKYILYLIYSDTFLLWFHLLRCPPNTFLLSYFPPRLSFSGCSDSLGLLMLSSQLISVCLHASQLLNCDWNISQGGRGPWDAPRLTPALRAKFYHTRCPRSTRIRYALRHQCILINDNMITSEWAVYII